MKSLYDNSKYVMSRSTFKLSKDNVLPDAPLKPENKLITYNMMVVDYNRDIKLTLGLKGAYALKY